MKLGQWQLPGWRLTLDCDWPDAEDGPVYYYSPRSFVWWKRVVNIRLGILFIQVARYRQRPVLAW